MDASSHSSYSTTRLTGLIALLLCAGMVIAAAGKRDLGQSQAVAEAEQPVNASILAVPELAELSGPRTVFMEVTAYCPCPKCCGPKARGLTASGKRVTYNAGRFVAADTAVLPFGSRVSVPGYHDGQTVEVIDRGGAIKGNKLDVYFPDHESAKDWGRQTLAVQILD